MSEATFEDAQRELEQIVETEEVALPELAITLEPRCRFGERLGFDATGTLLCARGVRDEPGALEHLEVLRDGGLAHRERLRELRHRCLTRREAREDGASRGIGEGGEHGVEARG